MTVIRIRRRVKAQMFMYRWLFKLHLKKQSGIVEYWRSQQ